jgi:hypothetical protein
MALKTARLRELRLALIDPQSHEANFSIAAESTAFQAEITLRQRVAKNGLQT